MNKFIYLAGPIIGCNKGQANDWRDYVNNELPDNIIGVSPLRCEPRIGRKYKATYEDDPRFGTAMAIKAKNEFDTRNCDLVLAYLPKEMNDKRPSYGTVIEMAWAYMIDKPVMLVTDDKFMKTHPLIQSVSSWMLDDLDQAVETIVGVMEVYTHEGRQNESI